MSADVDVDEEKAILSRLLGSGLSTDGLAAGLQWVLAMVRKEIAERPCADGECPYLPLGKLRKRFGYSNERMNSYLRRMKAENKVRIIQPTDENGKKGDCRYHVGDVESWMLIAGHGQEKH